MVKNETKGIGIVEDILGFVSFILKFVFITIGAGFTLYFCVLLLDLGMTTISWVLTGSFSLYNWIKPPAVLRGITALSILLGLLLTILDHMQEESYS